jgi:O-antigen/teichoic acid export membrane protein
MGVTAVALAAASASRPAGLRLVTLCASLSVLAASYVEFTGYAFRGLQRVPADAALTLIVRVASSAAGAAALWIGLGLGGFAGAQLVAVTVVACGAGAWLRGTVHAAGVAPPADAIGRLLAQSWPLGLAILVSIAYTRLPTFLLDAWLGAAAVGQFGVAQRLVEPAALIPAATMAAVFPAALREDAQRTRGGWPLRRRAAWWLAALGAIAALVGVVAGNSLIAWLYGSLYAGAAAPFRILAATVVLTFVNYALTHYLVSFDRQRTLLACNLAVFATAAVACAVLVPRAGLAGAALAMTIAEMLLLILCLNALWRASGRSTPRLPLVAEDAIP